MRLREDFTAGAELVGCGGSPMDGHARMAYRREAAVVDSSLSLTDYQFELKAGIDQKAMGWTFRSGSVRNYYASKLGSWAAVRSTAGDRRYIVLEAGLRRVQLPCPFGLRREHISRESAGRRFALHHVDQWPDWDSWNDRA